MENQEAWWQEALEQPDLRARFDEVHQAVVKGDLTLAQVGGFTPEELDSAYAATCKLITTGKLKAALQVAGYLILIDPWQGRNYYLTGVCFHRLGQCERAVHYYQVALKFDEDAVTTIALGEAKLVLGERKEARLLLQRGVRLAQPGDEASKPHFDRAIQLLSTYLQDGGAP